MFPKTPFCLTTIDHDYQLLPSYPLAGEDLGETFHFQQEARSLQHEHGGDNGDAVGGGDDGGDNGDDVGGGDDGEDEDDGQHILRKLPILNRNKRSKVIQEKAFQKVFWFCVCTVCTVL